VSAPAQAETRTNGELRYGAQLAGGQSHGNSRGVFDD